MITIIDYRMGNLGNVKKAFAFIGAEAKIAFHRDEIRHAEKLVLPGVGSFGRAMSNLRRSGLHKLIIEMVQKNVPILGICLGMQLFMERGEEGGKNVGLGLIPGTVKRFEGDLKIPHVGWNQVQIRNGNTLLKDIPDRAYFYFVHSYYVAPTQAEHVLSTTEYGTEFVSGIGRDNIFGFQFHPEKSQKYGLQILKNFVAI